MLCYDYFRVALQQRVSEFALTKWLLIMKIKTKIINITCHKNVHNTDLAEVEACGDRLAYLVHLPSDYHPAKRNNLHLIQIIVHNIHGYVHVIWITEGVTAKLLRLQFEQLFHCCLGIACQYMMISSWSCHHFRFKWTQ